MNKLYIITLLTTFTLFVGCTDFIEVLPPTVVMEDFYVSEQNAYLAVIGCYDVIAWDGDHNTLPFFFGDIIGRDGHKGGDIGGDQEWMDPLINFTYSAENHKLNLAWKNYYIGINRCNSAIENIGNMSVDNISEETKQLFIAEARFVRGYFYFELVKTFGSVPLIDHVLSPSEYDQELASVEDIWGFIESDFDHAAKYLPTVSEGGAEWYGRATKGAADAFRAKAYVYQEKWGEALDLTDSIINIDPQYFLLGNYEDVFKLENEHSSEMIFEIEFMTSGTGDFGDENEGNMLCVYMTTRSHDFAGLGGWGFNCPTQDFADEFEPGDPRLEVTVIRHADTLWKGTPDESVFNTTFPTNIDRMSNKKFILPPSQFPSDPYDAPKNWIVIRYADVLLWNAEAGYHSGIDRTSSLLEVRNRPSVSMGASPIADPLEAIYHERRVELGMEGHRFWDVVRQGRGETVFGAYGFQEGVHNTFPIPQTQVDLGNF
jgi:hypothetical protein